MNSSDIVELDQKTFEQAVASAEILFVDCWASWCKACKDFEPVFEAAAKRHPTCTFAKVNTEEQQQIVDDLGIEHIPSLVLYRDGVMLFNQAGYFDGEGLDGLVAQTRSLDMDEVRATIEAEARAASDASLERMDEQSQPQQ